MKDFHTVWMPWWTVEGRRPNRMERWAAHLLPPLNMGPEFGATGGEAGSRLRVNDDASFDVIQEVTTRYRQLRGLAVHRRQDPRPEVSIYILLG